MAVQLVDLLISEPSLNHLLAELSRLVNEYRDAGREIYFSFQDVEVFAGKKSQWAAPRYSAKIKACITEKESE